MLVSWLIAFRRLIKLTWAIFYGIIVAKKTFTLSERAQWQQQQARRMLDALETRVSITGQLPADGLIVCNHLSYLDVLIIAAQSPLVFVSKSVVIHWPIIGRLLKCAGTILADRRRRSSASETTTQMLHVINKGIPIALFPEGTSSDGSSVLPFIPTLLQIAIDTRKTITPAAITYQAQTGDLANDVCYWGDHTFFTHLIRLAKVRALTAHLIIGQPLTLSDDRKSAARSLHREVSILYNTLRKDSIHKD